MKNSVSAVELFLAKIGKRRTQGFGGMRMIDIFIQNKFDFIIGTMLSFRS